MARRFHAFFLSLRETDFKPRGELILDQDQRRSLRLLLLVFERDLSLKFESKITLFHTDTLPGGNEEKKKSSVSSQFVQFSSLKRNDSLALKTNKTCLVQEAFRQSAFNGKTTHRYVISHFRLTPQGSPSGASAVSAFYIHSDTLMTDDFFQTYPNINIYWHACTRK